MKNPITQSVRAKVVLSAMLALLFLVFPARTMADDAVKDEASKDDKKWTLLFDGKTLDGWTVSKLDADKKAEVKDGVIIIGRDDLASGVKYDKPFPKTNYEILYQAKRAAGYDFFGTITFPVKDSYCSFVNGGWSGNIIGLSSIDGYDASENETTAFYEFKDKKWYQFRVCVTDDRILVWFYQVEDNGKPVEPEKDDPKDAAAIKAEMEKPKVNLALEDKRMSTRLEVTFFQPLGISTWNTEGHLRDIKFRELKPEDVKEINLKAELW